MGEKEKSQAPSTTSITKQRNFGTCEESTKFTQYVAISVLKYNCASPTTRPKWSCPYPLLTSLLSSMKALLDATKIEDLNNALSRNAEKGGDSSEVREATKTE